MTAVAAPAVSLALTLVTVRLVVDAFNRPSGKLEPFVVPAQAWDNVKPYQVARDTVYRAPVETGWLPQLGVIVGEHPDEGKSITAKLENGVVEFYTGDTPGRFDLAVVSQTMATRTLRLRII